VLREEVPGRAVGGTIRLPVVRDGGDHMIVLGPVRAADTDSKAPLTCHVRWFGPARGFTERI
jgi:hypothetical protein